MFDFPWWAWVLFGLVVVVIGYLKLKVFNMMMKKKTPSSVEKDD
jgi:hypothetical protein